MNKFLFSFWFMDFNNKICNKKNNYSWYFNYKILYRNCERLNCWDYFYAAT